MQRPRILHIFSRYGDVGGEEVCFRAITEELRAVADVTPFVYSTAELFQSPHGALTKMRYMLRNRRKSGAKACAETAMTRGSSTTRSRPCPPASTGWP